jgi:hypothetical protein
MFSFGKQFHTRPFSWTNIPGATTADFGATLASSRMTAFARRDCDWIMPSIWRRSGPNKNLHDQRGSVPTGSRKARLMPRRPGVTFWHRPYKANRAASAGDIDFGGTQ